MAQSWNRALAAAFSLAAALSGASVSAASQGSLGPVSRGALTISITIRPPTRVSGLSDIAFDGVGAAAVRDLCLRGAPRAFTLVARGSGADGALALSSGNRRIPYRVEWQPSAAAADASPDNALFTIRPVAEIEGCSGLPGSGRLRIALDAADAELLRAGPVYTGSLILTLAPE